MATKKKKWTIPYHSAKKKPFTGDTWDLDWLWRGVNRKEEMIDVPPYEFEDTLTFKTYYKGRSSVQIEFTSEQSDHTYLTGMGNFSTMIPHMVNGVISGKFGFTKQGTSIFIEYLGPAQ